MSKVVIIGGGAAGMSAAIGAAECGHDVSVYEKNEKLGKKIYITGKGRCNLTNGCDTEDLFRNMVSNGKFLYSAIYGFTNFDIVDLVEANGCPVKEERGARMFPVSDHASDVTGALERKMKSLGVKIFLNEPVRDIVIRDEKAAGIILEKCGCRCGGDRHRRTFLPVNRFHGGRVPFCKRGGPHGDTSVTGTCSVCMRRR